MIDYFSCVKREKEMNETNGQELTKALEVYRAMYGNTTIDMFKLDDIIRKLREDAKGKKK